MRELVPLSLLALPFMCWLASWSKMGERALRRFSSAAAMAMAALGALLFALPTGPLVPGVASGSKLQALLGEELFLLDSLRAPLPMLAAALWLLAVLVTPRTSLNRRGLRRSAAATTVVSAAFLSSSPALILTAWLLSVINLRSATGHDAPQRRKRHWRVSGAYLHLSSFLLAAGIALVFLIASEGDGAYSVGMGLIIMAALIRKGIVPMHAWMPSLFEHQGLGPAVAFCAPQLGSYAVAVLVVPRASMELLELVAMLSLLTAAYGAALALVQRSARRACAYLFMSQSSLVMAGLVAGSQEAVTGALVLWISSSLAFAALTRCVLVIEARHGRVDLLRHHGGYERKPLLAVSFLLLGLSCTGFPGTLGFVGEELLVEGAVAGYPLLGFLVVLSSALTGLAILRMYMSIFCGPPSGGPTLDLRRREAIGFAAVVLLLIATGVVPAPLVRSRLHASTQLVAGP